MAGSKLNRSETVTVRLDPRLNYLTELAGRAQRRTKSSFIEWALQEALKKIDLGVCPCCEKPTAPDTVESSGALNRLQIHARLIDYPGGEIGFRRDTALAQVGRNPEGQDPQGLGAEHEHAVGEADAPNPLPKDTPQ